MTTLDEGIGGAKRIIGGPFGSNLTQADYALQGVPVIRGSNMEHNGRWIGGEFAYVSAQKAASDLRSNIARPGDIIVTQRGTMGQVSIVPDKSSFAEAFVISQSQMAISVDPGCASRDFVYYYLRSPQFSEYLSTSIIQTGVPHINLGILRRAPADWPVLDIQVSIAAVLTTLDDKIELNRRMNETLEGTARAIFKDWFVDFGPTHAKKEGCAPYLAPDIWSLFPEAMGWDGKPEGWIGSTIGQEVEVVGGSTPSTKEPRFWGGDIAWATPKDLSSLSTPVLLSTERKITAAGLSQISSGLLPVGTVLLSSRAPIGYMAIAQIPVAVNQGFIAMICNRRLSNTFVWLWTQANMETVHQKANGSTFQEISKANFRPIEVAVATPDLLRAFDETARPLFNRIVSNEQENRTLAATRDFLLPKLMSGEVRVKEAEKIGEEAT